jgi:hypothetical protein
MMLNKLLPPTPKKGALVFFALKNIKFWEKALLIGKIKLKNFPRFRGFLKKEIYFEK